MIKFTEKSGLVRIWARKVYSGERSIEDVPKISNLVEAVKSYVEELEKGETV